MDVLRPLPQSKQGNKNILIAADYFKWVEVYPLMNQEAVAVAEVLIRELIGRFRVPLILYFDQGWNFESAVFSEMCKLLEVTKTRTTPLHPQSNGMVERFNRTLGSTLNLSRITNKTGISTCYCYRWLTGLLFMKLQAAHWLVSCWAGICGCLLTSFLGAPRCSSLHAPI